MAGGGPVRLPGPLPDRAVIHIGDLGQAGSVGLDGVELGGLVTLVGVEVPGREQDSVLGGVPARVARKELGLGDGCGFVARGGVGVDQDDLALGAGRTNGRGGATGSSAA